MPAIHSSVPEHLVGIRFILELVKRVQPILGPSDSIKKRDRLVHISITSGP